MEKVLPLLAAMLLWSAETVAQNYLHIWTGESTEVVPMADLDSITIRDTKFYANVLDGFDGAHFTASAILNAGGNRSYDFDVTLTLKGKNMVYIENLDPYFATYGYTSDNGYNKLAGEAKADANGKTIVISCPANQKMGYDDTEFVNYSDLVSPITFTVNLETLEMTCNTGYGVYSPSQKGFYTTFGPFALQYKKVPVSTVRKVQIINQTKVLKQPQINEDDNQEDIQLMPCNTDNPLIVE